MEVKFKKVKPNAKIPTRGSNCAAGYDLYSTNEIPVAINPGETVKFETGIAAAFPDGCFGGITARSGLSTKKGLRLANCLAVIDSDYRGEISIFLHNDSNKIQTISPSERIAQLILFRYETMEFVEVNELNETERGENGFGSTGRN